MLYLDSILLIILVYFIYSGYKRGFVLSLNNFLLLTLGAIAAYFVAKHFASTFFKTGSFLFYLSFFLFFILTLIGVRKLLKKLEVKLLALLKKSDLMWLNSLLGALLGFLKVAVVVFIIISVLGAFQIRSAIKPISQSFVASSLYSTVRHVTQINLMRTIQEMRRDTPTALHKSKYYQASKRQLTQDEQVS
jgi:uncharacterized membrane protein required for colicin V production